MPESVNPDTSKFLTIAFRRRARLIIGVVIAGAVIAALIAAIRPDSYEAEASLLFRDPGFDQRVLGAPAIQVDDPERQAATNLRLVSLDVVAEQTGMRLDPPMSESAVTDAIGIETEGQSDVVTVTATDEDPERAADIANTFAETFIAFRKRADRERIGEAIRLVKQNYDQLDPGAQSDSAGQAIERRISQLESLRALQTGNAELVQRAAVPASPSSLSPVKAAALAAVLFLIVAVLIALVLERIDRRLKTVDEVEGTFQLPLLTAVPRISDGDPANAAAHELIDVNSFLMLRARLRYFNVDREMKSILITSCASGDGKTTIALNFALSNAMAGGRTILVETDMHRPVIGARADLKIAPGLAEVLSGQASLGDALQTISDGSLASGPNQAARGLSVLTAGLSPPNPAELLESTELSELVSSLSSEYDLVVLDTPPLTMVPDAIPLVRMVSGVLVVARMGTTTRDQAVELMSQLNRLEAPLLGVVANRVKHDRGYYGQPYTY